MSDLLVFFRVIFFVYGDSFFNFIDFWLVFRFFLQRLVIFGVFGQILGLAAGHI